MKTSQLFTKTTKSAPADEVSKNAQLLIRAGFVYKVMAGVYAYTPLGLKTLENIKQIIREEMNKIGGQELIMTTLQRKETWESTGRWDESAVDVWFKTRLQDDTELGLAWSHEEAILELMKQFVVSYKDLPTSIYQFQTKLRNELRAKSGVMRGREFVMKDMYSLHASQEDMDMYYGKVIEAYKSVFERLGVGEDTFVTFASGGSFTKFSHEFQTLCDAGEDIMYVSDDRKIAVNEEVLDDASTELGVDKSQLKPFKTAETGNIFKFGTEKSEKLGFTFTGEDGQEHPVYLASYGIGITRMMGVLAEKMSDEKGLVWPADVAPFKVYLARLGNDGAVSSAADELYRRLTEKGITVLYDDSDKRPGEKFADADLIGLPYRIVVSGRTVESGQHELKGRTATKAELLEVEEIVKVLSQA